MGIKSILITGIGGFIGSHLAHHLVERNYQVIGLDRNTPAPGRSTEIFGDDTLFKNIDVLKNDLNSVKDITALVAAAKPDAIIHLAGTAYPPIGWKSPADVLENNAVRTARLLEGAREANWKGRCILASSSDVYGSPPPDQMPLNENSAVYEQSPYAASKLTAERFALFFRLSGIEVIIARPFNAVGAGQNDNFVVPSFLIRIAIAAKTGAGSIATGDMESIRDFADVRDTSRAYETILSSGTDGEIYNICSGEPTRISDLFDICTETLKTSLRPSPDPMLKRQEGPNMRYGDAKKLESLGWTRNYSLKESVTSVRDYLIRAGKI